MDKLWSLTIFITCAEQGSFAAAAQALGTDPSTVSKAMRKLEEHLKLRLFHRNTRKTRLTPAGEEYLRAAKSALGTLDVAEEKLRSEDAEVEGRLRINLPLSFGRQYMVQIIREFQERYPAVECELSFSDRHVDAVGERFDITLRTGAVRDSRLVARQLTPMDFLTCATPDFARNLPAGFSSRDFERYPWVRYRFQQSGKLMPILWDLPDGTTLDLDPDSRLIVDDSDAMVDLCAAGAGLCQAPHFCLKKHLDAGTLVSLFPRHRNKTSGIFLIYPTRSMLPARIRAFNDFLAKALHSMGETPQATWTDRIEPWFSPEPRTPVQKLGV